METSPVLVKVVGRLNWALTSVISTNVLFRESAILNREPEPANSSLWVGLVIPIPTIPLEEMKSD